MTAPKISNAPANGHAAIGKATIVLITRAEAKISNAAWTIS